MTTKIHASGDARGNPTGFPLTPGQACDRKGSDVLLPNILGSIEAFLADKAYDAQERVLNLLEKASVKIVIPPKSNRKDPREYDKDMYQARHLIENFFAKLKQYRAIAIRYHKRASAFLGAVYLAAAVIWLMTRPRIHHSPPQVCAQDCSLRLRPCRAGQQISYRNVNPAVNYYHRAAHRDEMNGRQAQTR